MATPASKGDWPSREFTWTATDLPAQGAMIQSPALRDFRGF